MNITRIEKKELDATMIFRGRIKEITLDEIGEIYYRMQRSYYRGYSFSILLEKYFNNDMEYIPIRIETFYDLIRIFESYNYKIL